jgi:hypothetical protein
MPPNCPHAVFTPKTEDCQEGCLAVGGHFLTAAHLSSSLEGLHLQELYPAISNEDLNDKIYAEFEKIIRDYHDELTDVHAQIVSSCSFFLDYKSPAAVSTALKASRNPFLKTLGEFRKVVQDMMT